MKWVTRKHPRADRIAHVSMQAQDGATTIRSGTGTPTSPTGAADRLASEPVTQRVCR
jgi:hypothetical protein